VSTVVAARIDRLIESEQRAHPGRHGHWLMFEAWEDLLLASWPIDPAVLRPIIPPTLEVDTFDGTAWVSIVPFRAADMRLFSRMGAIPGQVQFPELNFRTYVKHAGTAGVYFLSLDCPGAVASFIGSKWFGLPFKEASMTVERRGGTVHVRSQRITHGGPPVEFAASYSPRGTAAATVPGALDDFLTNRLSLFVMDRHGHLHRGDIWHEPWLLQPVDVTIDVNTIPSPLGITLPGVPLHAAFAARTDSLVYLPARVETV
jgi:uncharacterized protein